MTNLITLTIPNDDHIALRAFGKALEEMALAHGAEPRKTVGELSYKVNIDTTEATAALERLRAATETLQQAAPQMMDALRFEGDELQGKRKEPEIDTTAQQVESLAVPMGDDEEQVLPTADSNGTPWDERIHSTSKALNVDGTWRLRRKPKDMDEVEWAAFVETVKGELSEGLGTPAEAYLTDDFVKSSVILGKDGDISINTGAASVSFDPAHDKGDETAELTMEPLVTPPGDDFHTDADVVTEQTVAGIPPIPVPPPVVVAPPVPEFDDGVPFPPSDTVSPALERMADHSVWDFPRLMTFLTERHGKIDVATVNTLLAQDGMSSVQELNAHPDKIGPFVARVKAHLGE